MLRINSPYLTKGGNNMAKLNTQTFIMKSNEVHNNKYDYSKSIYINSTTKINITCKEHGEFEQLPLNHLAGRGCNKCGRIACSLKKQITEEQFFSKVKEIYKDKYTYLNFKPTKTNSKIQIKCPEHGIFETTINSHLYGNTGCPKCGNDNKGKHTYLKNPNSFIEKANKIHNFKFNYSLIDYKDYRKKVKIICPEGHIFEQTPANHLSGNGCSICKKQNNVHRRSGFIKLAKDNICTFYIIKCFNNEETFYKIGITSNSVEKRYQAKSAMPYNYEIITKITGIAGNIWDLEKLNLKHNRIYRYQPLIYFKGSETECFSKYEMIT
jgi:hypothetical protein